MRASRGDVVLITHPFSDASGARIRPAVVVQCDRRNAILGETIIALITKNLQHVGKDDTQWLIDIQTAEGKQSGLNVNSAVKAVYDRQQTCFENDRSPYRNRHDADRSMSQGRPRTVSG
jgi:mRNA-degrading endonuclease toxin of MazEF toxin-antitoxin module